MEDWRQQAETDLKGILLSRDVPMSRLTTFRIGGPLDLLAEPKDPGELQRVLAFCREHRLPWLVLGLGSNLLVRDKGIRGVGIRLGGDFKSWRAEGVGPGSVRVKAGAAVTLADLSRGTARLGLTGLEFACGIPGSLGGAVFMNAGAYDGELSPLVTEVEALDPVSGPVRYSHAELEFGYRFSRLQREPQVLTEVILTLAAGDPDTAMARIDQLTNSRESKQPLDMPSAGSVFRRPPGHYVGPLIEAAGLKGFSIGGAQVSTKHAGFIVNTGNATAQDVLDLIAHIQRAVKAANGVDLIPEYRVIGEE